MDRDVIDQKLEALRRCLQRVQIKCPADPEVLLADLDMQDVVSLNLSRAVQLSVDIGAHMVAALNVPPPNTMGHTFDLLADQGVLQGELAGRLKKAVGFRNIAVHNYAAINWYIVHSIAKDHLNDFSDFALAVVAWANSGQRPQT